MEYKSFELEVKALDAEKGTFDGYASVFGNVDLTDEIVERGAFTKTLQERGDKVAVCWQHDWKQPIGRPIALRETDHGLYIQAKISDTQLGREALTLLRDGVVKTLSIGYDVIKDEWTKFGAEGKAAKRVRKLQEVRLYEVSLVTVAANPQARVLSVKEAGQDNEPSQEDTQEDERLAQRKALLQELLNELMKG